MLWSVIDFICYLCRVKKSEMSNPPLDIDKIVDHWDQTDVLCIVQRYAELLRYYFDFKKIILFGSDAKGNPRKDSDIDIAIVFSDYENRLHRQVELMKLTRQVDTRIEPNPFREHEFVASNPFVHEIISSGMEFNFFDISNIRIAW